MTRAQPNEIAGMVMAGLVLLWAGTAHGGFTPQQDCNKDRVKAWRTYLSCVGNVVARDAHQEMNWVAKGVLARCRHTYVGQWTRFQRAPLLQGSSCSGSRFTDNGTTVTDNLTTLQWEKKTTDATVHDVSNLYEWSANEPAADGAAFQTFLPGLNAPTCFAGQCDWRLPNLAELETILADYPCANLRTCNCPVAPCIDTIFGPTVGPTGGAYWTGTSNLWGGAWYVVFGGGSGAVGDQGPKYLPNYVRAVRGGL